VIAGQLTVSIEQMTNAQSTHPYVNYLSKMNSLRQRAGNISELAQEALRLTDEQYYDQMKALVMRPWRFVRDFGSASVDPSLRWPIDRDKTNTGNYAMCIYVLNVRKYFASAVRFISTVAV